VVVADALMPYVPSLLAMDDWPAPTDQILLSARAIHVR
jgi:hypothetical protein